AEDDLLVIGGVVVTSVALTIEDLLRLGGTPRHQSRALELTKMIHLDTLVDRFQSKAHLPGMDTANYHLEGLLDQAALTAAGIGASLVVLLYYGQSDGRQRMPHQPCELHSWDVVDDRCRSSQRQSLFRQRDPDVY